jgi:hypothetical protein
VERRDLVRAPDRRQPGPRTQQLAAGHYRKRTALYELRGNFEGGPVSIREWGELLSAGDTSYAGVAPLGGSRFLVTWHSSPLAGDPSWLEGFQGQTDIWQATLDLSKLRSPDSHTAAALRQHTPD